jgi:molybdate transport system permease protein
VPAGALSDALDDPVVREALTLSLVTTSITLALAVVVGTPVAWLLARYRFPGHDALDTLIDLPMVLPPAVAGVALLMAFGRRGVAGPFLSDTFGIELPFTTVAVVLAQAFVATPFFVKAAKAGFESVDPELEDVAATLGVSRLQTFWTVTVPLALPALLGGAVMTWARALGEFGATIMFAGNFIGRTQTMPLAIYQTMESGRLDAALALSAILIVVSFSVLVAFKILARRVTGGYIAARPRRA